MRSFFSRWTIQQINYNVYFAGLVPIGIVGMPFQAKLRLIYKNPKRLFYHRLKLEDCKLSFNGEFFKNVKTDLSGGLSFDCTHLKAGLHHLEAATNKGKARFPIYVLPPDKKILICDIDGTISNMSEWQVPFKGQFAACPPHSNTVLNALSEKYQILYITARDDLLHRQTFGFLEKHGFPKGPIFYRNWFRLFKGKKSSISLFKDIVIKRLKNNHVQVVAGIGNSIHDIEAYTKNGIPAYILNYTGKRKDIVSFDSYLELEKMIG